MHAKTEQATNVCHTYRKWFLRFLLYNCLFLSVQLVFIASQSSSFIHTIPLPNRLYIELIATLIAHIGLYVLLSILQTALLWGIQQHWRTQKLEIRIGTIIWWLSTCALLTSNAYFFPLSLFSRSFLSQLPQPVLVGCVFLSTLALGIMAVNTIYYAMKKNCTRIISVLACCIGLVSYSIIEPIQATNQNNKLNIILIGIDSLPIKAISTKNTPTLAQFIHQSVLFKETISPLARTYPAWMSILTGLYPEHHYARYNLIPPDMVKNTRSIAWSLRDLGYQTLFATDDRRFNNMGADVGFQTIIGPKLGVNDILLGTFNDCPLSNLLVNFRFAGFLFPYNHINRASYFNYYPQSFDNALHHELIRKQNTSPFFIAVHFTLPHWPYAFAASTPTQVNDEYSVKQREQLYIKALQQTDKQVATLLATLQQRGYLNNSLVVLLSDHGESLYIPGSRQTTVTSYQGTPTDMILADYFKRKTSTTLEMSAGHGSDILSPLQYHCVLAFKLYKNNQQVTLPKQINTRVALIDIAPTIQKLIGLTQHHPTDGISLLNAILKNNTILPERTFFLESGMLPNQFLSREKARLAGQQFFMIDKTSGELRLRKDQLATLDAMKLYGIIEGDWLLALYPDDGGYISIIQRLSDGAWVDNINSTFAKNAPAITLLKKMQLFYNKPFLQMLQKNNNI